MTWEEYTKILDNGPSASGSVSHHGDPEHRLQVECVRWFRYKYPNIILWANPLGGKRDKITGAKLKAEGALAGTPDITILTARKGYHQMFIEMKNGKKGRLSDAQKELFPKIEAEGNKVVVCRTFEEFEKAVTEYLE